MSDNNASNENFDEWDRDRARHAGTGSADPNAAGHNGYQAGGYENAGYENTGYENSNQGEYFDPMRPFPDYQYRQSGYGQAGYGQPEYGQPVTDPALAPAPAAPAPLPVSSSDLSTSLLIKPVQPAPTSGWRRLLYSASGHRLNVGNSAREQRRIELTKQVNQPLNGCNKIAVLSLKGGVGKTTVTATLGATFSSIRGDRVIAVDANPDRGTLSQKLRLETDATVRTLLRDVRSLDKYSEVRRYTSQNTDRLEVLASDADPAVSEAFSDLDYDTTINVLERFYSIVLTDCGTGLLHSAMSSILRGADSLVIVSSGSVDGARSASATLDWLDAHGYRGLVEQSIAVVNMVRPQSRSVDLHRIIEHFEQRCRAVRVVPFDPHLEQGAEIELERLRPKTRAALLELAAAMAATFPVATTPQARRPG